VRSVSVAGWVRVRLYPWPPLLADIELPTSEISRTLNTTSQPSHPIHVVQPSSHLPSLPAPLHHTSSRPCHHTAPITPPQPQPPPQSPDIPSPSELGGPSAHRRVIRLCCFHRAEDALHFSASSPAAAACRLPLPPALSVENRLPARDSRRLTLHLAFLRLVAITCERTRARSRNQWLLPTMYRCKTSWYVCVRLLARSLVRPLDPHSWYLLAGYLGP